MQETYFISCKNIFNPKGIFVRNDVNLRKLEGFSLENEIYNMLNTKKYLTVFAILGRLAYMRRNI
ncbi:MAG: hypothetical protein LBD98_04295 [Endomicrobium sp.]|jgi:hypothetical protein|nr:hypothetical protein [Endomicrobium sp.]